MALDKRSCMARAERLLADSRPENLRYAALELRLCIEALTYEKLRAFSEMVPEEVLRTWQPPQAVKALLEFEPRADQSFVLFAGREEESGQPAAEMHFIGKHKGLRLGWLRKHYNKLGNVLHAPSATDAQPTHSADLAKYIAEVIADLREPLESTLTGGAIRDVYSFTCSQCKRLVIGNASTIEKSRHAVCLNPQCKAEYFANISATGEASFQLMVTPFECAGEGCTGVTPIENRKLDIGVEFACSTCGLQHVIVDRQWSYGLKES